MYNLPEINKDDKDFIKKTKYKNIYTKLIDKCLHMKEDELGDLKEIHHILPRCMGGSNEKSNLVTLPIKYHIMAHYLLAIIYDDNYKLGYTLNILVKGREAKYGEKIITDNFSVRSITKMRTTWLSSVKSDQCRKHRSEIQTGSKNSNYGVKTTEEKRKKISEGNKLAWKNNYERLKSTIGSRGTHNAARRVKGPDGTIYPCLADAVDKTGIPNSTLRGWMKGLTKDNHGWSYVDPRNNKNKQKD